VQVALTWFTILVVAFTGIPLLALGVLSLLYLYGRHWEKRHRPTPPSLPSTTGDSST